MRAALSQIDKYELKAVLARTASSVIYDAWDADIARRVAIKTVSLATSDDHDAKEMFARFKRGTQAAGKLSHPNIVAIYNYGQTEDSAYVVMEFVDGPTLKQLLDRGDRFDLPAIRHIMEQILDGLQYSHAHGVVHRDIKPSNIMFSTDQRLKITDFGIARPEDNNLTQTGMVVGTPAYMSPEQFMGDDIDPRSDLYSVGVVLYHMVTGARPYDGSVTTIMHKVLNAPVPRPSVLSPIASPAIDQLVTRSMAKRREDRFQSAVEFKAAVQAALAQPAAPPPDRRIRPIVAPRPDMKAARRQPAPSHFAREPRLIAAGLAIAASVLGVGMYLHNGATTALPTAHIEPANTALASTPRAAAGQPSVMHANPGIPDRPPQLTPVSNPASTVTPDTTSGLSTAEADPSPFVAQPKHADAIVTTPVLPPVAEPSYSGPESPPRPVQGWVQKTDSEIPSVSSGSNRRSSPKLATDSTRPSPRKSEFRDGDMRDLDEAIDRLKGTFVDRSSQAKVAIAKPTVSPNDTPPDNGFALPINSMNPPLGLLCQSLTPGKATEMGLDSAKGMLVMGVTAGSPADRAGIRQNDVLLQVNGSELKNISEVKARPGKPVQLEILRNGLVRGILLTPSS